MFITFSLSSWSTLGSSNINCTLMINNYFSLPLLKKELLHTNLIPFSLSFENFILSLFSNFWNSWSEFFVGPGSRSSC